MGEGLREVGSEAREGGTVWLSGVGTGTYLVTSGPPILSGSSETLGEERGPECLIWTQGASSPPPHRLQDSAALPWPQCLPAGWSWAGEGLESDLLSFPMPRTGAHSEMVSAGRRKDTEELRRQKKQAGGQRQPHAEGATHTRTPSSGFAPATLLHEAGPFKAAPSLPTP